MASFHLAGDGGSNRSHLLGGERKMVGEEVHIGLAVDGHEMDMCVGHFKAHHSHTDALAGERFFHGCGYLFGKKLKVGILLVGEVENIVDLALGYDEGMARSHGTDVEECVVAVVLGHLVAGNFAGYYSGEYACHDFRKRFRRFQTWRYRQGS